MTDKEKTKRMFIEDDLIKEKEQKRDLETYEAKHRMKMEELTFEKETNRLFHEWSLERGRINRAEERKLFMEKRGYR